MRKLFFLFSVRSRFVFATKSIFKRSTRMCRSTKAVSQTCSHSSCVCVWRVFVRAVCVYIVWRRESTTTGLVCSDYFIIQQTLNREKIPKTSYFRCASFFASDASQSFDSQRDQVKVKCAPDELRNGSYHLPSGSSNLSYGSNVFARQSIKHSLSLRNSKRNRNMAGKTWEHLNEK